MLNKFLSKVTVLLLASSLDVVMASEDSIPDTFLHSGDFENLHPATDTADKDVAFRPLDHSDFAWKFFKEKLCYINPVDCTLLYHAKKLSAVSVLTFPNQTSKPVSLGMLKLSHVQTKLNEFRHQKVAENALPEATLKWNDFDLSSVYLFKNQFVLFKIDYKYNVADNSSFQIYSCAIAWEISNKNIDDSLFVFEIPGSSSITQYDDPANLLIRHHYIKDSNDIPVLERVYYNLYTRQANTIQQEMYTYLTNLPSDVSTDNLRDATWVITQEVKLGHKIVRSHYFDKNDLLYHLNCVSVVHSKLWDLYLEATPYSQEKIIAVKFDEIKRSEVPSLLNSDDEMFNQFLPMEHENAARNIRNKFGKAYLFSTSNLDADIQLSEDSPLSPEERDSIQTVIDKMNTCLSPISNRDHSRFVQIQGQSITLEYIDLLFQMLDLTHAANEENFAKQPQLITFLKGFMNSKARGYIENLIHFREHPLLKCGLCYINPVDQTLVYFSNGYTQLTAVLFCENMSEPQLLGQISVNDFKAVVQGKIQTDSLDNNPTDCSVPEGRVVSSIKFKGLESVSLLKKQFIVFNVMHEIEYVDYSSTLRTDMIAWDLRQLHVEDALFTVPCFETAFLNQYLDPANLTVSKSCIRDESAEYVYHAEYYNLYTREIIKHEQRSPNLCSILTSDIEEKKIKEATWVLTQEVSPNCITQRLYTFKNFSDGKLGMPFNQCSIYAPLINTPPIEVEKIIDCGIQPMTDFWRINQQGKEVLDILTEEERVEASCERQGYDKIGNAYFYTKDFPDLKKYLAKNSPLTAEQRAAIEVLTDRINKRDISLDFFIPYINIFDNVLLFDNVLDYLQLCEIVGYSIDEDFSSKYQLFNSLISFINSPARAFIADLIAKETI